MINPIQSLAILFAIAMIYFIPWIVASRRGLKNSTSIGLLNLFLGWTLIGWVISLCWASSGTAETEPVDDWK